MKKFDLNIEKILENWETYHAIREIISNALDEQTLSNTKEVEIYKEGDSWFIRDFGRGLQHTHLTQNENQEKLSNPNVIGKFGIGLKDAFATFDRKGVTVTANSKHCQISISKSGKEGFQDIITLHADIDTPKDTNYIGTEFQLMGVSDQDIEDAKNLFLMFSGEKIIEKTKQGSVIEKKGAIGNIYINGVKVAEEENFLFSYNITVLNASIKKALNRERANVGRSAYTDSVKKILLATLSKEVAEILANDLMNISRGTAHDELTWIDVQEHSVKILNQQGKYLFITSSEAMQYTDMLDQANSSGHNVILIPDNLKYKIQDSTDFTGNPIMDIGQFVHSYNDSFEFNFIEPEDLSKNERQIFQLTPTILDFFGGKPNIVSSIKISSTMRKDFLVSQETNGCWDSSTNSIVIARQTLNTIKDFSGTLIHELIHAKTGNGDVTRDFETNLTKEIGHLCELIIKGGNTPIVSTPQIIKQSLLKRFFNIN
jgi:hypothetical protein